MKKPTLWGRLVLLLAAFSIVAGGALVGVATNPSSSGYAAGMKTGLLDFCDTTYGMQEIGADAPIAVKGPTSLTEAELNKKAESGGGTGSSAKAQVKDNVVVKRDAYVSKKDGSDRAKHGLSYVKNLNSKKAERSAAQAYQGAGLEWTIWGDSKCDITMNASLNNLANGFLQAFVVTTGNAVGLAVDAAFTTVAVDTMANIAESIRNGVGISMYNAFAGVIFAAVIVLAAIAILRSRDVGRAFKQGLWAVVAIGIAAFAFHPIFAGATQKVAYKMLEVGKCVALTSVSECNAEDLADSTSTASFMKELVGYPTWAVGQLGDTADKPVKAGDPERPGANLVFTIGENWHQGPEEGPKGGLKVEVPTGVIPRVDPKNTSIPTYAEVFRWTQTYTDYERAAMIKASGGNAEEDLVCAPTKGGANPYEYGIVKDLDTYNNEDVSGLCRLKTLVRMSIMQDFANNAEHESAWQSSTKASWSKLVLPLYQAPLLIATLSVGFAALVVLFQGVMFTALVALTPIVALVMMKRATTGRLFLGMIVTTLYKIMAAALALALSLAIITAMTNPAGAVESALRVVFGIAPGIMMTVRGILVLVAIIAAWMMYAKILELTKDALAPGGAAPSSKSVKSALGVVAGNAVKPFVPKAARHRVGSAVAGIAGGAQGAKAHNVTSSLASSAAGKAKSFTDARAAKAEPVQPPVVEEPLFGEGDEVRSQPASNQKGGPATGAKKGAQPGSPDRAPSSAKRAERVRARTAKRATVAQKLAELPVDDESKTKYNLSLAAMSAELEKAAGKSLEPMGLGAVKHTQALQERRLDKIRTNATGGVRAKQARTFQSRVDEMIKEDGVTKDVARDRVTQMDKRERAIVAEKALQSKAASEARAAVHVMELAKQRIEAGETVTKQQVKIESRTFLGETPAEIGEALDLKPEAVAAVKVFHSDLNSIARAVTTPPSTPARENKKGRKVDPQRK